MPQTEEDRRRWNLQWRNHVNTLARLVAEQYTNEADRKNRDELDPGEEPFTPGRLFCEDQENFADTYDATQEIRAAVADMLGVKLQTGPVTLPCDGNKEWLKENPY